MVKVKDLPPGCSTSIFIRIEYTRVEVMEILMKSNEKLSKEHTCEVKVKVKKNCNQWKRGSDNIFTKVSISICDYSFKVEC